METLPLEFSPLFWDVDVNKLDSVRHAEFIVERLLEKGNWKTARWVWHHYHKEFIYKLINTSRNISRGPRNLWKAFFKVYYPDVLRNTSTL